jgi:hypothetical protein
MQCPNCGKDYRDVPEGNVPGHYYRGDEHFGKKERRFGRVCNNCGFCAEFIVKPTGLPYRKREMNDAKDQLDMFGSQDSEHITQKLLSEIEFVYNKTRGIYKDSLSSIIKDTVIKSLGILMQEIKKQLGNEGNRAA